ncbi:hypothetical protein J007_05519 [Cryptococcus neoformans]|nr:hypothetical protein J007_05519 [Cryptococcus neoformans var. grubii]
MLASFRKDTTKGQELPQYLLPPPEHQAPLQHLQLHQSCPLALRQVHIRQSNLSQPQCHQNLLWMAPPAPPAPPAP